MVKYKVKILLTGPSNAEKRRIADFLNDVIAYFPPDFQSASPLRILEFDLNDIEIDDKKSIVEVQLWEMKADESQTAYWPFYGENTDGIVFVCSSDNETDIQMLDQMYNFFVAQKNTSHRACLVCLAVNSDKKTIRLSPLFSKISQITVDVDTIGEKFKQEFSKYIVSVVNNKNKK